VGAAEHSRGKEEGDPAPTPGSAVTALAGKSIQPPPVMKPFGR
jgi:hypothetical protein